jgi:hypothetical protein
MTIEDRDWSEDAPAMQKYAKFSQQSKSHPGIAR